jgi:hypothetical protein
MQRTRYAALILRQTLALPTDAHPLDEALVIVTKASYQHLGFGYIGGVAPFFSSMMKLFIPPNLLLWSHAIVGFVQQQIGDSRWVGANFEVLISFINLY